MQVHETHGQPVTMRDLYRTADRLTAFQVREALKAMLAILYMDDLGGFDRDKDWDADVLQAVGCWVDTYFLDPPQPQPARRLL